MITSEIIRLARKHVDNGDMASSARLCLADAVQFETAGFLADARRRALASLAYSVGILHLDYQRAAK